MAGVSAVSSLGKKVYIPVTDDNNGSTCTNYYNVQYRITGTTIWNTMQPLSPLPLYPASLSGSPAGMLPMIVNTLLINGTSYDINVQRFCCDGSSSDIYSTTYTTPS